MKGGWSRTTTHYIQGDARLYALNHIIRIGTTRFGSDVMVQYGGRQSYFCFLGFLGKFLKTYTCLDVNCLKAKDFMYQS